MTDRRWHFDYAPIPIGGGDNGDPERDLVLATEDDVDPARLAELLAASGGDVEVSPLHSAHPVFWTRIRSSERVDRGAFVRSLDAAGVSARYLVSARRGSQHLPPPLELGTASPRCAREWRGRQPSRGPEPNTPWRWFLRGAGADVERVACGTGAGVRLAVIDNDGCGLERVALDAEVLVDVESVPRASVHAALLCGWAVGARTEDGSHFRGIAPDASPRLYCIPKAGDEIVSLSLAIVRAVEDGADVIVCATYVEGLTSPLLDDALEFATRLGRGGRGTAVVMPTGREMSSPPESLHSSLSIGPADPGSDPRVFCVGPSARDGGWFVWRDRHGRLRPFANRGPAVRFLAPGDDMAFPFATDDRPAHAESSGASGVFAGVLALVLEQNPGLELAELDRLLSDTVVELDPAQRCADPELGDPSNLLPSGRDPDGHNAKHGYGRVSATEACLTARDPVSATLVRIGERGAAIRYLEARDGLIGDLYTWELGRWGARALLHDARLQHAFSSLARTLRLTGTGAEWTRQAPGQLLRQIGILVRLLARSDPPQNLLNELSNLDDRIRAALSVPERAAAADDELLAVLDAGPALGSHEDQWVGDRTPRARRWAPEVLARLSRGVVA